MPSGMILKIKNYQLIMRRTMYCLTNRLFFIVFAIISLFINAEDQEKRPTVCLNMIVKNESHIITRCLSSMIPIIDYWVIVDTGSLDNTPGIIKEFMEKMESRASSMSVPGSIFVIIVMRPLNLLKESRIIYFSWTRTIILPTTRILSCLV